MKDSRNRKRLIRPVYCSKECREKAGIQRAVKKRREKYQNDPEYRAHVLELNARLNKLPKYKEIFCSKQGKKRPQDKECRKNRWRYNTQRII